MKLKTFFVCLLIGFFSINIMFAGVPMLVKAKITDKHTGSPMEVEVLIKDSKGKKIKLRTNSISGEFQQVLNSGEEYTITFNSPEILRQTETFRTDNNDKYFEQKLDFKVNKVMVGAEVFDFDLFSPESGDINSGGKSYLEEVKMMLRFNRSVSLNIKVNADDSFTKKAKGNQEKKDELIKKRIQAINDYIQDWGSMSKKVNIITDSAGASASDTKVEISSVDDVMNQR